MLRHQAIQMRGTNIVVVVVVVVVVSYSADVPVHALAYTNTYHMPYLVWCEYALITLGIIVCC